MKIKAINEVYKERSGGFLEERFGKCYAQISTINTLKVKSAILDTARFTYGHVPPELAAICHKIATPQQGLSDAKFIFGYEEAGTMIPGSITWDPALQEYVRRWPEQWKVVLMSLRLIRSLGRHAGGYAIANEDIENIVPVTTIKGYRCTAVPMQAVEYAGILKYDFLLVSTLDDIQRGVRIIQDRSGVEIPDYAQLSTGRVPKARLLPQNGHLYDIWTTLPRDCKAVFEDIVEGRVSTIFQFDSHSVKQWLPYFAHRQPNGDYLIDSIEKMAIFTALDRPGPLNIVLDNPEGGTHNALVEYTRRARGLEGSSSVPEIFNRLFPETLGILCFQEQLTRAYKELTGCDGIEAERFRGEVGKKQVEKIEKRYKPFLERVAPKYGEEAANKLWAGLRTWSEYGFNFSHAQCYVVTGYVCGYLKHFFGLEWWCGVLQNADKNEIGAKFWAYCRHLVDLPHISKPATNFEIHGDRVITPISQLMGVGQGALGQIVKYAPYTDIRDFCQKVQQHKVSGATYQTIVKEYKKKPPAVIVKQKLGRSAINEGTAYTMIVAGVMDSLFPPGTPLVQKLQMYHQAQSEASGDKLEPVRPIYLTMSAYGEYMARKKILPMWSQSLVQLLVDARHPKVVTGWKHPQYKFGDKLYRMAEYQELESFQNVKAQAKGGFWLAVGGLVVSTRNWRYGQNKESEACEVNLEIEGNLCTFKKWPDRATGNLDKRFNAKLENSLVVLLLNKWSDRPFTIADVDVIESAPESKKT